MPTDQLYVGGNAVGRTALISPAGVHVDPMPSGGGVVPRAVQAVTTEAITATLAVGAAMATTARDGGSTAADRPTRQRPLFVFTGPVGTWVRVELQQSEDGTTDWRTSQQITVPADGLPRTFDWTQVRRFTRWNVTNLTGSAGALTAAFLQAMAVRAEGAVGDSDTIVTLRLPETGQAAGATYTSPVIDLGGNHAIRELRAAGWSDQATNVVVDQSYDGTNWFSTNVPGASGTVALAAGTSGAVTLPVFGRFVRLRLINQGTASTFVRAALTTMAL